LALSIFEVLGIRFLVSSSWNHQGESVVTRLRRIVLVVALAILSIFGFAVPAHADSPVSISRDGGTFSGAVGWYHYPTNHGAMRIYGTVRDNKCDGHNVYFQGRVEGYGFTTLTRLSGGCGTSAYVDNILWDPQALNTNTGAVRVCIDISFAPDPCTEYRVTRTANP
jgi:hypothetical protein